MYSFRQNKRVKSHNSRFIFVVDVIPGTDPHILQANSSSSASALVALAKLAFEATGTPFTHVTTRHMKAAQSRWGRLTTADLSGA